MHRVGSSIIALAVVLSGCAGPGRPAPMDRPAIDATRPRPNVVIEDLVAGDGAAVGPDSSIVARMTGRLEDGTVFFATDAPTDPWPVRDLVEGLARGVRGMAAGGRRRVTVPPALGYGDRAITDDAGRVVVPAGSTLVFDVEVIAVVDGTDGDVPEGDDPG